MHAIASRQHTKRTAVSKVHSSRDEAARADVQMDELLLRHQLSIPKFAGHAQGNGTARTVVQITWWYAWQATIASTVSRFMCIAVDIAASATSTRCKRLLDSVMSRRHVTRTSTVCARHLVAQASVMTPRGTTKR